MNKREIKTRMLKVSDSDYVDATLPNLSSLWPHSFILAVLDLSLSLSLSLSPLLSFEETIKASNCLKYTDWALG